MKTTQEKIQKTSKTLSIVLNIVKVITIVGAVVSAAALIIILFNRAELAQLFVEVGEFADAQAAAVMMPMLMGVLAFNLTVDAVGCHQLYRIFKDISREGTPFAAKHVRRIKTVAWLSLPMSLASGTLLNVQSAIQTGDPMTMIGFELMWLVFGTIIYCLAFIFDYGCQLQQESDETL